MNVMSKRGFTLIELLIVIAILAAAASITVLSFTGTQATARDTRRKSDLKQYQNGLETFANRNNSFYPSNTGGVDPNTLCATLGLVGCATDPRSPTSNYTYRTDGSGGNTATRYVLYAILEKPQAGTSQYWVTCSNGTTGRAATGTGGSSFASGNCPAPLIP